MIYKVGDLVDAWSSKAVVESVDKHDFVLVRYTLDCGDEFLAGRAESFPSELLSPWRKHEEKNLT